MSDPTKFTPTLEAVESQSDPEFTQIALTPRNSSEGTESMSTIYDPAALTLDPKYIRKPSTASKTIFQSRSDHFKSRILMSPRSPAPGRDPFSVNDLDGDPGKIFDGLCGLSPLRSFVFAVNSINVIAGLVLLVVGSIQFREKSYPDLAGMRPLDSMIVSGPIGFNIFCVIVGIALIGHASLGFFLVSEVAFGEVAASKKCLYFMYQSLVLLAFVVLVAISALIAFVFMHVRSREIYNRTHWMSSVQEDPANLCRIEERFECAGFQPAQCSYIFNETAFEYCPGQFCVGFCHVTNPDDANNNTICDTCFHGKLQNRYDFRSCAQKELVETGQHSCQARLNEALQRYYRRSLILSAMAMISVAVLVLTIMCISCCTYTTCD